MSETTVISEQSILVDVNDTYHVITLNRPDKLNSFNDEMHRALYAALEAADADDNCRAILLTAAGKGFCAGQDLGDRVKPTPDSPPPDLTQTIGDFYNPLIRKLKSINIPIVCAVNGVAAGAGANIAMACDIVIASEKAKFIQAFAKIGLVPDSGGTYFLPRLVGSARARGLAMLGTPITAAQAAEWGMIWKCSSAETFLEEATAMVQEFSVGPTIGLGLIKQALNASEGNTLDEQLDLERDYQGEAGRTPDYLEGVTAFMDKRAPKYSGKR
ncbi:1,2-epoxyphenylacetyl-CoA isomerase [Pseudovibrio sp. W64]|uniref:2-(1,2-epoxy-1,2-dihydrophenyl)acetyl-CoA isomerase PaaG n=1 Tax=unclassified Pseudovibrio TaxID=2627060 RepID=UPI0007B222DC|nr:MULTISPECIES: 2-(1,2-epoxy-1,2-dihydrophenyl)acetyl-CoA isomerase PaaG [unclassified Pseudovibrio]KZK91685.1 1,2-epoxyphenylacetyl-CoA isomerase [Pseudovibrio sp. W64]KZL03557.1 1,2-epoxyphenylacetyl-CoA isomerase [Pseudovibrio sp. W74]KZL10260.1 1,2-epoxyphenylacetyl-CoA isomerase [Pseudovibrio sp. Ad14]